MKAVVLAAGHGTRLGALTAETAKPALAVGGSSLVAHVVAHLAACGFREIAVNLHYRAEQIRDALGDGSGLGVDIAYFEEEQLLGTAGALVPMAGFLETAEAFVVQYADVLTDHDLGGMLERHRRRDASLTMLVHERPGSNSVVMLDADDRVTGFLERPTHDQRASVDSRWVNSGIYAAGPELLALIPQPPADVAADVVPRCLERGRVYGERLVGFRCAVDSSARLAEAEAALAGGRWRSPLGARGPVR